MKLSIFQKVILICIGCVATVGCEQDKVDTKTEEEKLMQASREWSKAAEARDIEKTMAFWSDDATVISAGEPVLKNKQAIRQMVEGSMKDPNFSISWNPISAEVSESGDMGYLLEESKITLKDSIGKPMILNFNTITIWKKQDDGSWKNVVDAMIPAK